MEPPEKAPLAPPTAEEHGQSDPEEGRDDEEPQDEAMREEVAQQCRLGRDHDRITRNNHYAYVRRKLKSLELKVDQQRAEHVSHLERLIGGAGKVTVPAVKSKLLRYLPYVAGAMLTASAALKLAAPASGR